MLTRRNFSLALGTAFLTFSGCNPVKKIVDEFDKAIAEFRRALTAILQDSQHWKIHTEALIDRLDGKVRASIEDGTLGRLVCLPIDRSGAHAKTLVVMIERRILGYLNGVIKALENKKEEARRTGGIPIDTVESVIAEVIASVRDVAPFVGVLSDLTLFYRQNVGSRTLTASHEVLFEGFGFDGRQFRLVGLTDGGERVWAAPPSALTRNTDFVISFAPTKASVLPPTVEKLALEWTDGVEPELASILLTPAPLCRRRRNSHRSQSVSAAWTSSIRRSHSTST